MRIGIVGCGAIAKSHRQAYALRPEIRLAACFDANPEAARNFAAECGACAVQSVEQMLTEFRLDAVSVCTPPAAHFAACLPFLRAGIAVLCEKPLAADLAGAAQLAQAAETAATPFMTAFCHRFHPPIVRLKELIGSGSLGRPLLLRNIFGGYRDISGDHRACRERSGGGVLIDNCSHSFDLVRHLLAEPETVSAESGNLLQAVEVEDFCLVNLACAGGARAQICSSYSLPVCGNWVEWFGTEGMAAVSYWNPGQPELTVRHKGVAEPEVVDCAGLPERFYGETEFFLDCIRNGKPPRPSAQDGLAVSRIVDAAYRSSRERRIVSVCGGCQTTTSACA